MKTFSIILLSFVSFKTLCFGQTKPISEYYLPKTFSKPGNWKNADKARAKSLKIDTSRNIEVFVKNVSHAIPRALTLSDYLGMIHGQSDFYSFLAAKNRAILQYEKYFPYLISFLTDTTIVGLSNTDYPMIFTQDSPFLADTSIVKENLITVAGRVECILNELTDETFAMVQQKTTIAELKYYQLLWVNWIKQLKK